MGQRPDIIAEAGLQFFGRITASISHELKNVLAIINENAGLLEDLTLMADRGKPIDPARLKTMAAALQKQIGRANAILTNMNRFAHSSDETAAEVNLHQTIDLFLALTDRFTAMQGIELDLQRPAGPLTIPSAPFYLLNLLWLCLEFSMTAAGGEKRLELVIVEAQNSVRIRFRRLAGLTEELSETFPSDRAKNMLAVLGGDLMAEPEGEELVLQLPKPAEPRNASSAKDR